MLGLEVEGRVALIHLPQSLQDPLVLRDDLGAIHAFAELSHVSLHQPLDLMPPLSNLVGRFDQS